jgi:proline iminopeptidase
MNTIPIRGVSLHTKIIGHGPPLALMHGGPGADLYTMMGFRPLADQHTLIFYDHRCNGRSTGADLSSFTFENLTADADALRQALGFEKWVVLGHSFGGFVALEYALRYPQSLSHLVLVSTGGDKRWSQENGPRLLVQRGFDPEVVELAKRWVYGRIEPDEYFPSLMKLTNAYIHHFNLRDLPGMLMIRLRTRLQPETFIWAEANMLKDWSVMERLGEIQAPTLLLAGRYDFLFPPEHQEKLAAGIPNARLAIIDNAAHSPEDEQPAETLHAIREFLAGANSTGFS